MPHPYLRRALASLLAASLAGGCGGVPSDGPDALPPDDPTAPDGGLPASGVDLVRDARGVPHLYGATLERAIFALGYASAQDRLFQMHLRRSTMRGRLAELFAVPAGTAAADAFNAKLISSDRVVRTIGYARHAEAIVDDLPGDVPALLAAYAAGVNAHVGSAGFALPPAFATAGVPTFEPWTPADSLLAWDWVGYYFTSAHGALQGELDQTLCLTGGACPQAPPCALPIDEAAAVVPPPTEWPPGSGNAVPAAAPPSAFAPADVLIKASHGWVVAGTRTTTGKPVLVGEPQLALEAPSTWYEAHLAAGDVNVRGASLAGAPAFIVFWNDHLAQTATAGGADVADLVALDVAPDGLTHTVDGAPAPIASRTETILVRGGAPIELVVRTTGYGPIVDPILTGVPAGVSYAGRLVEQATPGTHSLVGAIEAMRADSLASYQAALAHWAVPAINALYAGVDADAPAGDPGHIAYHALARLPARAPQQLGDLDVTGRFPIDGTSSANVWTTILDRAWNPHVVDPADGYLFSGNHLPVGPWHQALVHGGFAGNGDTYRSLRVRYRLAELLPPGGAPVEPELIHAMHVDDEQDAARLYVAMLTYLEGRGIAADPGDLAAAPAGREQRAARIRLGLQAWLDDGGHLRSTDPRAHLAATLIGKFGQLSRWQASPEVACVYGGGQGGASFLLKDFDARGAAVVTPEVVELLLRTADETWDLVDQDLPGLDPAGWDAPQAATTITVRYQVNFTCLTPGGGGSCSLTTAEDAPLALDATFSDSLNSAGGSSYPLTVDFADPEATRAVLPPGVSEDPASAFFHDGLDVIVAKAGGDPTLPVAPRARATVDATAVSTLHLD